MFSQTREEHLIHLQYVMEKLKQEKMLINLSKFTFIQEELVYLGFVISKEGLKIYQEKVKAIMEWPSPKNFFEVRSFHGLASFYKKFIRNFSYINTPMLETIRKSNQPFVLNKEVERSFQTLKKKVSE